MARGTSDQSLIALASQVAARKRVERPADRHYQIAAVLNFAAGGTHRLQFMDLNQLFVHRLEFGSALIERRTKLEQLPGSLKVKFSAVTSLNESADLRCSAGLPCVG